MKSIYALLYLCQAALAGNLYAPTSYAYPASTLVAPQPLSQLHYASPLRTSTGYGPLAAARVGQIAAPILAPAPSVYAPPAPVLARYSVPTAYAAPIAPAAPILQKYAAVPAVADVPITRYEAQPGFIQKYVDVAHPKVATTKIQIRRPAIQKQFYDIEERIVVRPIASAVVELDQPLSKSQAGPTLISPALPAGIPVSAPLPPIPTYGPPQPLPPPTAPQYPSASENPQSPPPSAPQNPEFQPSAPQNPEFQPSAPQFPDTAPASESDDSDSITVENEDVRARSNLQQRPQARQQQEEMNQQNEGPQARSGSAPQQFMSQTEARFLRPQISRSFNNFLPQPQSSEEIPSSRSVTNPQISSSFNNFPPQPQSSEEMIPASRSGASPQISRSFNNFPPQQQSSDEIIPSSRSQLSDEQSQLNQQRLIELLTGRGGIAEVRSGVSIDAAGEAGQIRGRVLSVTPAPPSSGPADEKVSTRRIVVSRPIQTLQEVDVVQPFTKLQRISVQHPAILKTPRVDIARVKTFAPVPVTSYGAYTPYTYLH